MSAETLLLPLTAAQLERLRRDNQTVKAYLALEQPRTVFTAIVSGSPQPGATSVGWTSGGELESTHLNYTVWVGSTPGAADKGAVRLRAVYFDHIEVSFNHIDWQNGDYITIVNQVRPWTSFPAGIEDLEDGNFLYEDQNATVSTYNTSFPPIGRIGPSAAVAFIEADGLARVKFYQDSDSYFADYDLVDLTHAWYFDRGSPATSSAAATQSSPIEVTWSTPGQYMVRYVVSDPSGHSSTRWCRVFIFKRDEANGPVQDMQVESLTGSYDDGGWQMNGKLYGSAGAYIDGAMAVVFCEQFWGSEAYNIVHQDDWSYRDNLLFVGWIKSSHTEKQAQQSFVSFQAYGPTGWMKESASWPSDIREGDGSTWHSIPDCNGDKVFTHLMWWHTNLNELADVNHLRTAVSLKYVQIQEGNLYNQIDKQVYDAYKARLLSNRYGQLMAERIPSLQTISGRNGLAFRDWAIISKDDSRDAINLGEEIENPRVAQVDYTGFYYIADDPHGYSSFAPARELSTGSIERITGTRVLDQDEANELAGMHLAHLNNEFNDVEWPWRGFAPFDIAPSRRLYVNLSASENVRGLSWVNKAFWVHGVQHDFTEGGVVTTLKLEAESSGPAGITHLIPEVPPIQDGPPDPADPTPPSIVIPVVPPTPPPTEDGDPNLIWEEESVIGAATQLITFGDYVYIGGYTYRDGDDANNREWRLEKRLIDDGTLDWGINITDTVNGSAGDPNYEWTISGVYVDASGVYISGADGIGYGGHSSERWRVDKRAIADGAQVWSYIFPDPGTPTVPLGRMGYDLVSDGTYLYSVGKKTGFSHLLKLDMDGNYINDALMTRNYIGAQKKEVYNVTHMQLDEYGLVMAGAHNISNSYVSTAKRRYLTRWTTALARSWDYQFPDSESPSGGLAAAWHDSSGIYAPTSTRFGSTPGGLHRFAFTGGLLGTDEDQLAINLSGSGSYIYLLAKDYNVNEYGSHLRGWSRSGMTQVWTITPGPKYWGIRFHAPTKRLLVCGQNNSNFYAACYTV